MSITQEALGERIRGARLNIGFTQEQAAESIGLGRTALLQIEAGNRAVTSLELVKLVKLYRTDISTLLDDNSVAEDPFVVLGRVAGNRLDALPVRQEILRYLDIFREAVRLEGFIGEQSKPVLQEYRFPAPKGFGEAIDQGREMATLERKRLDLGSAPISDVAEIIAAQGVWTAATIMPDDMAGLFMSHRDIGLAILVNANHRAARRRFSYAHEYAHCLADRASHTTVTSIENASDLVEKRANAFASEFLLPEDGVLEFLDRAGKGGSSRESFILWDSATNAPVPLEQRHPARAQRITVNDVALLAHEFMVSYETAAYRLRDIRKIQKAELDELISHADIGRRLTSTLKLFNPEAEELPQQHLERQVILLALEAYRQERISSGRFRDVCEKVNLPSDELLAIAEAAA